MYHLPLSPPALAYVCFAYWDSTEYVCYYVYSFTTDINGSTSQSHSPFVSGSYLNCTKNSGLAAIEPEGRLRLHRERKVREGGCVGWDKDESGVDC